MRHIALLAALACPLLLPVGAHAGGSDAELEAKPTKRSVQAQLRKLERASKALHELARCPFPVGFDQQLQEAYAKEHAALRSLAQGTDAVVADLKAGLALTDPDLDSLSEMGEMESLRLQMSLDRYQKAITTLSNVLKKQSETSSSIVANLK